MQLIGERARRILVPFIFGIFVIVPIQISIWRHYNGFRPFYVYDPNHLWFLGNIFAYVLIFTLPLHYLRIKLSLLVGILLFISAMLLEILIVKPVPYEMYAMTWHGFFLGMIMFFFGYLFVASALPFWKMMWITIGVAIGLAAFRLSGHSYTWLIPVESISWILSVLSIGYKFLNKPGKALSYLSEAAYPVYIIHMIFQNLGSLLIFKLNLPAPMKFVMLVVFTLGGCLLCYELLIRRVKPVRLLFGLKMDNKKRTV
jgi:hypothetical protein